MNLCNMPCPSLEVLLAIRCQSCTASIWVVSTEIATLGQTLPGDTNYPAGHSSHPLCSKCFIQLQFLISREVICGYILDCPANCWMPEEAGGKCAAAGCVGFSFWFTVRTGGWSFKMPWNPDTICCSTGCIEATFCAERPPRHSRIAVGVKLAAVCFRCIGLYGKDLPSSRRQIQTLCEASRMAWLCLCWEGKGTYFGYRLFS